MSVPLRGSPAEGSLERPRQLGLSRSHSFMSGPLAGSGRGLADVGGENRGSAYRQYCHQPTTQASDSLEGLATPMLHRRHRQDNAERRNDQSER